MSSLLAFIAGIAIFTIVRILFGCLYTVRPDQRAVVTSFGAAEKLNAAPQDSDDSESDPEEKNRYDYPQLRVIGPGGPYFKLPWQQIHKVSVATQAVDLSWDPSKKQNTIEAVTKDNLTTGVNGQLRYRVSENNLYPFLFGVTSPLEHVMGYFISVLRERIANFTDPKGQSLIAEDEMDGEDGEKSSIELSEGVSINDLRKNLPLLNQYMEEQCRHTTARYGIELDAAKIDTLIRGVVSGAVGEAQIGAFLMAVYLRGMTESEQVALTLSMRDSGVTLQWPEQMVPCWTSIRPAALAISSAWCWRPWSPPAGDTCR